MKVGNPVEGGMSNKARTARLSFFLFPFSFCILAVAAAPPHTNMPEELIRRANDAFRAGDTDSADKLYSAAEERTADPGLVAFNRAAILFDRGAFREAEKHYDRVLDDAACPPERAAKAWYNRGTCLLRRGGTMSVYRSAAACFEHTLNSAAADEPLKADARHNLELAKLLWNEERKKAAKPEEESPNKQPPPEEDRQPKPEPEKPGGLDPNGGPENTNNGTNPKQGSQPQPQPQVQPKDGSKPTPTEQKTAGNNANLQMPEDKDEVQKLSPEEARAWLKDTSKRRKRELHSLLETLYGPERPGARDW
jgi:tetratricopeptide (TPR) repeat protein